MIIEELNSKITGAQDKTNQTLTSDTVLLMRTVTVSALCKLYYFVFNWLHLCSLSYLSCRAEQNRATTETKHEFIFCKSRAET